MIGQVQDVVEKQITVNAPRERVWRALTDPAEVRQWFSSAGCEIDLRIGGMIRFVWKDHGTSRALIDALDKPRVFAYRWVPGAFEDVSLPLDEQALTRVEYTLEEVDGGRTVIFVRETGFSALSEELRERAYGMNEQGWVEMLDSLHRYLAA